MLMNITHETIYPGFDGFSRSLKLMIMDIDNTKIQPDRKVEPSITRVTEIFYTFASSYNTRRGGLMNAKDLWNKIVVKAQKSEFELHTIPKNKRIPKWFLVEAEGNSIIIKKAIIHRPTVELSTLRRITFSDFELVFGYYDLWKKGTIGIRQEVSRQSRNTAYIFAIIANASE
jgi:hypothetical protein